MTNGMRFTWEQLFGLGSDKQYETYGWSKPPHYLKPAKLRSKGKRFRSRNK